jgi:hypothetical protein
MRINKTTGVSRLTDEKLFGTRPNPFHPAMIRLIKQSVSLALLIALTAGAGVAVNAAENNSDNSQQNGSPAGLPAKIIVVDATTKTLTVDIKGKIYRLKLSDKVKVLRDDKVVTIGELLAGQDITVVTQQNADGEIEVVACTIQPSAAETEAAGKDGTSGSGNNKDKDKNANNGVRNSSGAPAPFYPPPAIRPPVSPFH